MTKGYIRTEDLAFVYVSDYFFKDKFLEVELLSLKEYKY